MELHYQSTSPQLNVAFIVECLLSAVLIAIVTEYSIPSVGMTGLDYPKEPQRIFYTAQEEWAQKPMTNGQIAQLAPWLGALGEVTKEEYKKRLEQKLSDAIVKISDHEIEIKDHELYIAETKIDTFEQMKKYADARAGRFRENPFSGPH